MAEGKITRRVLIVGGSAGSLEVLIEMLPVLPKTADYAFVVVLHRKSAEDTILEDLIAAKAKMPVMEVEDKVLLFPGYIYVAPSDYHLLFEKGGELSLDNSEKVNYSRPSIDVSFESAAEIYGPDVTAILLSGANADGTQGLKTIKQYNGKAIIQAPETAGMPFMPENAISNITPDYILDIKGIVDFVKGF